MDWFIERLHYTNPTLDYQDLLKHGEDFKKLVDSKIIKHAQTLESLPCDWCEEDHFLTPFLDAKKEIVISCFGNHRKVSLDELKIWIINRDALIENVKSKNPIVDKVLFEETAFALKSTPSTKKYSNAQEPIKIKTLGIEIRGNHILKGTKKSKINDTDKCLIYSLYYKFIANKDECFKTGRLVLEIEPDIGKKSEGYIKNRIVYVNNSVRGLIIKGKTNIGSFIKHERGRGYHLNPKIMI